MNILRTVTLDRINRKKDKSVSFYIKINKTFKILNYEKNIYWVLLY